MGALSAEQTSVAALSHRTVAIRLLNSALSKPAESRGESDARVATALALTFQVTHFPDGLGEFLTMIRGCQLIATNDKLMDSDSAFYAFRPEAHLATMMQRLNAADVQIDARSLDAALASIDAVGALCVSDLELEYHQRLEESVRLAYNSPGEAYKSFTALYGWPGRWSQESFQAFISPDNRVAQVLLAHFLVIQVVLGPILIYERLGCEQVFAPSAMLNWLDNIQKTVGDAFQPYLEWPIAVSEWISNKVMPVSEIEDHL
ncbi:hypothetical protein W97_08292 [Coniosporium apollinis CBS 100218]|uniref:C6 transcription factor n=1 Tax=Coniosporium apollinis (strain CBS 100218) TaxID=1168221 RepID=R7Z5D2_CONA1|nr:uncharacterized protein W97_08292 [Coniosporium apollinis CBS 100218]EON69106.1 hypothetical protein W97_08292 [Coniosporium apollinis CBS 100218]